MRDAMVDAVNERGVAPFNRVLLFNDVRGLPRDVSFVHLCAAPGRVRSWRGQWVPGSRAEEMARRFR